MAQNGCLDFKSNLRGVISKLVSEKFLDVGVKYRYEYRPALRLKQIAGVDAGRSRLLLKLPCGPYLGPKTWDVVASCLNLCIHSIFYEDCYLKCNMLLSLFQKNINC